MTRPDVIALGEPLLRLSPTPNQTLEDASTLHLYVGGSEVNTLVGLTRLGHPTALLSRLPDHALGHHIEQAIRTEGVDTTHILQATTGRVGSYWYEPGRGPRDSAVIYDRAGSAMTQYEPDDLPPDLFAHRATGIFHTTGITLAVSASTRRAALTAMTRARALGWRVSFDTNYRSRLWPPDKAERALSAACALADILIVPVKDATTVFHIDHGADAEHALTQLRDRFPQQTIVVTHGSKAAAASTPEGSVLRQGPIATEGVDRIGRGDAFTAGLLHGVLSNDDATLGLRRGLRWGAAMAAMKFATPGDMPRVDVRAVKRLFHGSSGEGTAGSDR